MTSVTCGCTRVCGARYRPLTLGIYLALAGMPLVHAADETPATSQVLPPIVVTAPMQTSPLTVVTNPKAPRQPVPASDGADFLKSIPGFESSRKGGSNGDPMLRGMVGSRINILIDGGQIGGACPSRMDPVTAYISPQLYDKVTVIKGPETVLYGPGNSAGTVLFEHEFKRYQTTQVSGGVSLLGGSWGRNDQMLNLRAGSPDGYIAIDGDHTQSQDYKDGNGNRVHSAYDRWNTNVALGWTPNDDTLLELTVGKGNGHADYASSYMDGIHFLRESVGLKFERRHLSDVFDKLVVQLYDNYVDHLMDNYTLRTPSPSGPMGGMAMASEVSRRTVGGRAAGTFLWGNDVSLTAGLDGSASISTIRIGGPLGSSMGYYADLPREPVERTATIGAFGELNWSFTSQQRLISGLRVDRAHARGYGLTVSDTDDDMGGGMGGGSMGGMGGGGMDGDDMSALSPATNADRSAVLPSGFIRYEQDFTAIPATFYAGIGHVERFPDFWELFSDSSTQNLNSFMQLAPEKTTQLDVGLQYNDSHLKAWTSIYAGVVNDFILLHYTPGAATPSSASNVNARIAGGEAGMAYNFTDHWKADLTLAYTWGEDLSEHRPLPQLPPLDARLGLTYTANRWSAGMLWRLASAQHRIALGEGNVAGQDLGPSAGFGVLSINAGYHITQKLTLSAGIDNLLNKTYAEHVNAAGAGVVGFANTLIVNEPGRTGWVKLNLTF